jgi:hypothetical protein
MTNDLRPISRTISIPLLLTGALPRSASPDEHDVLWFFTVAHAELPERWDAHDLEARASSDGERSGDRHDPTHRLLVAAGRARRIRHVLDRIGPLHVRALQRWAAPPERFAEPLRKRFGRHAGLAMRTDAVAELGGAEALLALCRLAGDDRCLDEGLLATLERVRREANALSSAAFSAYARARTLEDAEIRRRARERDLVGTFEAMFSIVRRRS